VIVICGKIVSIINSVWLNKILYYYKKALTPLEISTVKVYFFTFSTYSGKKIYGKYLKVSVGAELP
jgi:hypothetical protein